MGMAESQIRPHAFYFIRDTAFGMNKLRFKRPPDANPEGLPGSTPAKVLVFQRDSKVESDL
jgi:hypothetical protein